MTTSKKMTVTVGVPAYNSQENISQLLDSILNQDQTSWVLKTVYVYIDAASDKTADVVRKFAVKKNKIKVFVGKKRRGMAFGFKYMVQKNTSDIFVLFNDDILLKSRLVISNLIKPFLENYSTGLVSGNPQPLPSSNFIAAAGISTFRAFERTRYSFRHGDNKWTCDGKILALSKKFIDKINFPKDESKMGNVDIYLYFSCLQNKFEYAHVRSAVVFSEFPNNVRDYVRWTTRGNTGKILMKQTFGKIVDKEYYLPLKTHIFSLIIEVIKNPIGSLFIFFVGLYSKYNAIKYSKNFVSTWEVVESTKRRLGRSNS